MTILINVFCVIGIVGSIVFGAGLVYLIKNFPLW